MTLRPGDLVGRYEVLCAIGAGGMAAVYAARVAGAEAFEKRVALKVMLPHLSRDPKFEKMFGDEARVAAQVQSPHVVGTIDLGRDETEGLYQVLELVVGGSLRQLLDGASEPLPIDVALTILAQAAQGLADAHAARGTDGAPLGLVHRDVSPHNVLVGVDGRARLSDFGVARAAASVSTTESGELKGKLAYAAPEQLGGETADARSDVFALGVVAWEALAGRRLFVAENPLALVDAMISRPIPRIDEVRPEVGAEVGDLLATLLVRDREARTIDAAEVARRLDAAARAAGGPASSERVAEIVRARCGEGLATIESALRSPIPARKTAAPPATTPETTTPRGWIAVAAVAVVIAVAAAATWARGTSGDTEPAVIAAPSAPAAHPVDTAPSAPSVPPTSTAHAIEPDTTDATDTTGAAGTRDEPGADVPLETPRVRRPPSPSATASAGPVPSEVAPPVTEVPARPAPREEGLLGVEDFDRDDPR